MPADDLPGHVSQHGMSCNPFPKGNRASDLSFRLATKSKLVHFTLVSFKTSCGMHDIAFPRGLALITVAPSAPIKTFKSTFGCRFKNGLQKTLTQSCIQTNLAGVALSQFQEGPNSSRARLTVHLKTTDRKIRKFQRTHKPNKKTGRK